MTSTPTLPSAPTTPTTSTYSWVLPIPMAPRAAAELVHTVATPLSSGCRRLAARLTGSLVTRVRDVVPTAVWLQVEVEPGRVHVEVADAGTFRPDERRDASPRRLPPQNAVGLPPLVDQHATASGMHQLDAHRRTWWFVVEGPPPGLDADRTGVRR